MMEAVFDRVGQAGNGIEYTLKASYIEIYREKLIDLLKSMHFF